jgi:hypothetical protein
MRLMAVNSVAGILDARVNLTFRLRQQRHSYAASPGDQPQDKTFRD